MQPGHRRLPGPACSSPVGGRPREWCRIAGQVVVGARGDDQPDGAGQPRPETPSARWGWGWCQGWWRAHRGAQHWPGMYCLTLELRLVLGPQIEDFDDGLVDR